MTTRLGCVIGAVALAAIAASCGGGQTHPNLFATDWEDDGGRTIEDVRKRLAGARVPFGADVAVAVVGNSDKIVGLPLATGKKWAFSHEVSQRPVIAGGVIVATGGREVFAVDALTGQRLWARETGGLELHGASDDGFVTVMTFAKGTGDGSVMLALARDGSPVRQIETDKHLGAPAVVQGLAFVPWAGQYVSVIDLANGNEAARVTLRENTSHAWVTGGALYFGEGSIFRFDDRIKDASKNLATHLTLPAREYAGKPLLQFPALERLPPAAYAQDKVRLYARPAPNDGAALASERYFATYFRFSMGLDAHGAALRWVHTHESDVLGGAAAEGSFVACDEHGKVVALDAARGGVVAELSFGEPLKSCVVQADAYRPAAAPPEVKPLVAQIEEAIGAAEMSLAPARHVLMKELAALPDDAATKVLVSLATETRAPDVRAEAAAVLAARRSGVRHLVEALERPYDYLKDVLVAPPVGAIARALVAMNDRSATVRLAQHLLDPADREVDVKALAESLVVLGDPAAVPEMKRFFALYRGTADDSAIVDAVVSVAEGLLKFGDAEARRMVERAARDGMSVAGVRERLDGMVKAPAPTAVGDAGTDAR